MKNLKILFVTDDNLLNSVVYDPHFLAEYLSTRGHIIDIIGASRDKKNCFQYKKYPLKRVNIKSKTTYHNFLFLNILM